MEDQETPLSLVLFSGTDDKLTAASVLAVGHKLSPEATQDQAPAIKAHSGQHWSELLRQAKDLGVVDIQACALSMDMFHLKREDLDRLVDGIEGVAAFMATASQGQVLFI